MISPYIKNIRKHIGRQLLLMPSVAVLVWQDERLLLVRNIDTGKWHTIGGAIEPEESPFEAAKRETREETGLEVKIINLRTVVGGPQYKITYPNGDQVNYVSIIFDAKVVGGKLRPDHEENSAVRWFSKQELAGLDGDAFTYNLLREALK